MPKRTKSKSRAKKTDSRKRKSKPVKKKTTKRKTAPRRQSKFKSVLTKVMKTSIDIGETLVPFVLKAAKNMGYKGAVGSGLSVLALLAQTNIGKEAARLLIEKTKDILQFTEKQILRDANDDVKDFMDVEEEIVFNSVFEKPTLRMEHWDSPAYRGINTKTIGVKRSLSAPTKSSYQTSKRMKV